MAEDEPPKFHVIATGDEEAIERRKVEQERDRALWHVDWFTRQLAANMIRVIRGAGRPLHLFDQVQELANAIRDCPEGTTVGEVIEAFEAALSDGLQSDDDSFEGTVCDIEAGALRKVAARLVRQPLQVAAGDRDLWNAYYRLESLREESRKRWERESRNVARLSPKQRAKIALAIAAQPSSEPDQPPKGRKPSTAEVMRKRKRELGRPK